jgi:phi13 family phage major tail protein
MAQDNKVVFGLRNAHYSIITEGEGGAITYGVPVPLKGAVEISLDPRGETTDFYADDILYYTTVSNQGYETTLTVANIPAEFRTDVLGETMEGLDMVLTENTTTKSKKIAFMFEFDGDIKAIRHCLYYCTVTRPSLTSATKTESAEPQTQELALISAPRPEDGVVKRSTTAETPDGVYNAWYQNVYLPAVV